MVDHSHEQPVVHVTLPEQSFAMQAWTPVSRDGHRALSVSLCMPIATRVVAVPMSTATSRLQNLLDGSNFTHVPCATCSIFWSRRELETRAVRWKARDSFNVSQFCCFREEDVVFQVDMLVKVVLELFELLVGDHERVADVIRDRIVT